MWLSQNRANFLLGETYITPDVPDANHGCAIGHVLTA